MKRGFYFTIGALLIIASLAGLVICVGGIYGAWQVRERLVTSLNNTLALLENTLKATSGALVVANDSMDTATKSVEALAETIRTTGRSVNDTLPMIDSLAKLTTVDLPETIKTTQDALDSAKTSAVTIDSTLKLVTTIPLLPLPAYDPPVPLGEALGDVSTSLDPLPESLLSMKDSLANTKTNLGQIGGQFDTIAADVNEINASLVNAKNVIGQYQQVVATLEGQIGLTKTSLPNLVNIMAWVFTVVLVWLGLTQVGLMMQGFEMIGMGLVREEKEPEPAVASETGAP
jgi:methyl-accepting chemotaxis protein